jgi:hypothetical protein
MTNPRNSARGRLSETPDRAPVLPFRHAEDVTRFDLYWLPASLPARAQQRQWTLLFLAELVKRLSPKGELSTELFVESSAIHPDRQEQFVQTAFDFNPVMGFSRKPGAPMPSLPKNEAIDAIRNQEKPFEIGQFLEGLCYWFLKKSASEQLDLFWGFGGMTMMLVKADPVTPPINIPAGVKKHPAFQSMLQEKELQSMLDMAQAAQSSFLKKTKEAFGKGWEDRVEYRGLQYILPRWSSRDFFDLPEDDVNALFNICEVFATESPVDQGVLLASGKPLRPVISDIVIEMSAAGEVFCE